MSENTPSVYGETGELPEAKIEAGKRGISLVWVIPLIAAIIGSWLAYKAFSEKGPVIAIRFDAATGLEAGKTKIKYKDVELGLVKTIDLSEDFSHVIVTAEMVRGAQNYLTENTRFWVVRARVAAGEVSGIGTIFSGAYIGIDPGKPGKPARSFVGLEMPPLVTKDTPGLHFKLKAEKLGSLDFGSPVYYRQVKVGQVVNYEMLSDGSAVDIRIFIKAPYDRYVFKNTRFWNASGVDAVVDSTGVKIKTESVVTLLIGGISFETPVSLNTAVQADEDDVFTLYGSYEEILEPSYSEKKYYLLYFEETVRGLEPGASVEFRGIKIGEVVDVHLEFHWETLEFKIPVLIALEIERIREKDANLDNGDSILDKLVEKGLRAQLKTGMLLTGQLYVGMGFFPDAPAATVDYTEKYPALPTMPAPLEEIAASLARFLKQLENLPMEQIGEEINKTLRDAQTLLASEEIGDALGELKKSLLQINRFSSNLNTQLVPKLGGALDAAKTSIEQIGKTLDSAESMLDPDTPVAAELQRALQEISAAARSIRATAEYLERHPDALIYGKEGPKQ